MNEINERLMTSLHTTYRTVRRRNTQALLNASTTAAPSLFQRGISMDRRRLTQMKKQYALLQRENVIREIAAILTSRGDAETVRQEQVSEKQLLSYLNADPEAVVEAIIKLEKEGYLTRSRTWNERKEYRLSLTEQGWHWATELQAIKIRQNEEFLKPLTVEERSTLITLLEKLNLAEEMGFVR